MKNQNVTPERKQRQQPVICLSEVFGDWTPKARKSKAKIKDETTDEKASAQQRKTSSKLKGGNSLAILWLGLGAFTAVAQGSIPGWGTKTPQVTGHG